LFKITKDISQALVLSRIRRVGEFVANAFFLDQRPFGNYCVAQLVSLGGEWLGQQVTVTIDLNDS
jgi:hypothetical protein